MIKDLDLCEARMIVVRIRNHLDGVTEAQRDKRLTLGRRLSADADEVFLDELHSHIPLPLAAQ